MFCADNQKVAQSNFKTRKPCKQLTYKALCFYAVRTGLRSEGCNSLNFFGLRGQVGLLEKVLEKSRQGLLSLLEKTYPAFLLDEL